MSLSEPARPTESGDAVAAVVEAHRRGIDLALPSAGTTGPARWVRRTTESWWVSFAAYSELSGVTTGARVWIPGPMSSTMNLFAAVHATDARAVLSDRAGATHAVLTPSQLLRHELPPGCVVTVAGGPLPARDAGPRVRHYYGAAELSFVASGPHAGALRPFPGAEVDVRGGEVWVRSPYVAEGYVDGAGPLRRDGEWATVGDLGRWDGDRLVVLGRAGAVTTAGVTVALADVEAELRERTTCELAAFGIPHDAAGELLCVAVAGSERDVGDLTEAARALAPGARPRRWLALPDGLPLTPAGKVDRAALAELLIG